MQLWTIIRDFFVQYIFGGVTSTGLQFGGLIGNFTSSAFITDSLSTDTGYFEIANFYNYNDDGIYSYISFGDWLSTTFTVITLILICYVFLKITVWLFKWGAGLFKW